MVARCRRDLDAEAARRLTSCNRQTQIRLGPADIERLIDAYVEGNSVLQVGAASLTGGTSKSGSRTGTV